MNTGNQNPRTSGRGAFNLGENMLLPELPEALIVRRNAHGFSHSFTALQMDKYGRDCAEAAQAEVARLTAELGDLPEAQAEMLSEIKALRAKNKHLLHDANELAQSSRITEQENRRKNGLTNKENELKYEFIPGDEITIAPNRTVKRIKALVAIKSLDVSVGDIGGYIESSKNLEQRSGNAWVSGNAKVYDDALVSGNAHVSGNAQVYGNAQVSSSTHVSGNAQVYDDALISGNVWVYGNAWVSDNAHVSGNAQVYGNTLVSGNARVFGDAQVFGDAHVFGDVLISGNALISGDAHVFGDARVFGDALISDDTSIVWFSKVGRNNGTLTAFMDKDKSIILTRGCFLGGIQEFLSKSEKEHDPKTHLEYRLLIDVAYSRLTR
jgi:carbonic anhydrase/acetyltransferase-like protein (isoleucine patch superfamily)